MLIFCLRSAPLAVRVSMLKEPNAQSESESEIEENISSKHDRNFIFFEEDYWFLFVLHDSPSCASICFRLISTPSVVACHRVRNVHKLRLKFVLSNHPQRFNANISVDSPTLLCRRMWRNNWTAELFSFISVRSFEFMTKKNHGTEWEWLMESVTHLTSCRLRLKELGIRIHYVTRRWCQH